LRLEDSEGNILSGGVLFNDECEKITGKKAEDFLFDEQPEKIVVAALIGTKVDVTISLKSVSEKIFRSKNYLKSKLNFLTVSFVT